jgi:hypothetical protein
MYQGRCTLRVQRGSYSSPKPPQMIKQECEKFDYDKPILEYLHRVWAKHRDYLRNLEQGSDAIA